MIVESENECMSLNLFIAAQVMITNDAGNREDQGLQYTQAARNYNYHGHQEFIMNQV